MVGVCKSNVPDFLVDSGLYESVFEDIEDENEEVNIDYFEKSDEIETINDFVKLLHALRYWMVNRLPDTVYHFLRPHGFLCDGEVEKFVEVFEQFSNFQFAQEMRDFVENSGQKLEDKIAENDYHNITKLLVINGYNYSKYFLDILAFEGAKRSLRVLLENYIKMEDSNMEWAAKGGHLECMKIIHEDKVELSPRVSCGASKNGHVECLKFALNIGCERGFSLNIAAINGHYECFKLLCDRGLTEEEKNDNRLCEKICSGGNLDILKLALSLGYSITNDCIRRCILHESLDCLYYIVDGKYVELGENDYYNAINEKKFEIADYLEKKGCPVDGDCCELLAAHGQFDRMKKAYDEMGVVTVNACWSAVNGGHIDCLKLAYEHEGNVDSSIMLDACYNGNIDCIKFVYEKGVKFNDGCIMNIVENNHIDALRFAVSIGCPIDKYLCVVALKNESIDCFKYLLETGVELSGGILVIKNDNVDILKIFLNKGYDFDGSDPCEIALKFGSFECLKILCEEYGYKLHRKHLKYSFVSGKDNKDQKCFEYLMDNIEL